MRTPPALGADSVSETEFKCVDAVAAHELWKHRRKRSRLVENIQSVDGPGHGKGAAHLIGSGLKTVHEFVKRPCMFFEDGPIALVGSRASMASALFSMVSQTAPWSE